MASIRRAFSPTIMCYVVSEYLGSPRDGSYQMDEYEREDVDEHEMLHHVRISSAANTLFGLK